MALNPWLVFSAAAAVIAGIAYYSREPEGPVPSVTTEDPDDNLPPPPPTLPPTPPSPIPKGPGDVAPLPPSPDAEPAGGWQSVLNPGTAAGALDTVRSDAASQPGNTWAMAVRMALEHLFPLNAWDGLLGGWQADARAYMIQKLDFVADRGNWPVGDDAKEAARIYWLRSSQSINECKSYNLQDTALASCVAELIFPGVAWPAAGTTGEPWQQEAWSRIIMQAGIV